MSYKNSENNTTKIINGLDSLRFIFALIVLLSHFDFPWIQSLKFSNSTISIIIAKLFPNLFCGAAAVIAFFIISGIVIHYPHRNGILNIKKFLIRRWIRIGIPLIIISIIGIITNTFGVIPIWSLYCELIFYTFYPILFHLTISWKKKFYFSLFLSILLIILFANNDLYSFFFQKNLNYNGSYWQLGDFLTWIIGLPCWILGILLAEKIDTSFSESKNYQIIGIRLFVFSSSVILNVLKFHFFVSFILSLNLFAFVLYYWISKEIIFYKSHQINTVTEKMGKFSYSIYLCHALIFILLKKYFLLNNYTYLLFIVITILLSYLFYLIIEKPSHLLARKLSKIVS